MAIVGCLLVGGGAAAWATGSLVVGDMHELFLCGSLCVAFLGLALALMRPVPVLVPAFLLLAAVPSWYWMTGAVRSGHQIGRAHV